MNPEDIALMRQAAGYSSTPPQKGVTDISDELQSMWGTPSQSGAEIVPPKSFGQDIADEYSAGAKKTTDSFAKGMETATTGIKEKKPLDVLRGTGEALLGSASGVVQTVSAPITAVMKKLADVTGLHPIDEIMNRKVPVSDDGGKTVRYEPDPFIEGLKKHIEEHPEAATNIADAINVLGGVAGFKSMLGTELKPLSGVASDLKSSVGDMYTAITSKSPEAVDSYIAQKFEKGVRPSVSGKGTATQAEAYSDRALDAVKTIVKNKDNLNLLNDVGEPTGKLPTNLKEFSQAIDQTKKQIFKQYDTLSKNAGETGASVDLKPVANELKTVVDSPVVQDLHPELVEYASKRMEALNKRGQYTTGQAQDAIKNLNNSLEAFYKNPSYETAPIDALVVNKLRSSLDSVIENAGEAGYQELKNQYGSLKTIEKDVVHRMIVDGRKNVKGLIDFADFASGAELVRGLVTMNPVDFAVSASIKGMKTYYKYLNNPNTAIKQMFKTAEKYISEPASKATKR